MIYGYARVSTAGQNLQDQIAQLRESGVRRKNIYYEHYTGTKIERPKFQELLKKIKPHDTLVVTKLDRLARNTVEAINTVNNLLDNQITIKIINLGTVENSPMGRMIIRTLASVAEMERDMIIERTEEGKAFAKAHNPNFREGRPKRMQSKKRKKYIAINNFAKTHSARETGDAYDVSARTVFSIKKMFKKENNK